MIIGTLMIIMAIMLACTIISCIGKENSKSFFVFLCALCMFFTSMGTWVLVDTIYPPHIEYMRGRVQVNFECDLIDSTYVVKDTIIKYKPIKQWGK